MGQDTVHTQNSEKKSPFAFLAPLLRLNIWIQLSFITAAIILLVVTVLTSSMLKRQQSLLYSQTVRIGTVSLNYFTNNAKLPLLGDNALRLNVLIKEARDVEGLLYAIIVDSNGVIKAHTNVDMVNRKFEGFQDVTHRQTEGDVEHYIYQDPEYGAVLNLTRIVQVKDKVLGEVHVGVSLDFISGVTRDARRSVMTLTLVILILGIGVSVGFGLGFSRPIMKLVEATNEIGKGNFQHRVSLMRQDELGSLAKAFNHMSEELWMKSLMQDSFGKYVGSEVLDLIMADPDNAMLKGHNSQATVLFTDIRGFTAFSETRNPEEVVEALNEYFDIATNAILAEGGYVDKFIGDAVLGVFGVPVFHEDHVLRGVRAAMRMQEQFLEAAKNGNPILPNIGVSVNAGIVMAGNIGSHQKMEYTVIGDTVNLASRLNNLAGSGEVIVSESVYQTLGDVLETEPLEPQNVKGKSQKIQPYRVKTLKG